MSGRDDPFLMEIAARIKRENVREAEETARRKDAARKEASRLALSFAEADDRIRRVYLFGSVLPGKAFRLDSDIDLAVEGGDLFRFLRIAGESKFSVDVLDMADIRDGIRERILSEGVILYGEKE